MFEKMCGFVWWGWGIKEECWRCFCVKIVVLKRHTIKMCDKQRDIEDVCWDLWGLKIDEEDFCWGSALKSRVCRFEKIEIYSRWIFFLLLFSQFLIRCMIFLSLIFLKFILFTVSFLLSFSLIKYYWWYCLTCLCVDCVFEMFELIFSLKVCVFFFCWLIGWVEFLIYSGWRMQRCC